MVFFFFVFGFLLFLPPDINSLFFLGFNPGGGLITRSGAYAGGLKPPGREHPNREHPKTTIAQHATPHRTAPHPTTPHHTTLQQNTPHHSTAPQTAQAGSRLDHLPGAISFPFVVKGPSNHLPRTFSFLFVARRLQTTTSRKTFHFVL